MQRGDDERHDALASALGALPGTTAESFDRWYAAVRDGPSGPRRLYGAHAAHVLRFDRDRRSVIEATETTPPAVLGLCRQVLALPAERLGGFDDDHLCLRLDDSSDAPRGRLLALERDGVEALLGRLFPTEMLTRAETRTLLQVVCGTPLRRAAEDDGVAHETKRSQLKAVSAKTGRPGQRELAGFVLARLLFDLAQEPGASPREDGALMDYRTRFLPPAVRLHVTRGATGSIRRLLDFGDRRGRVLVVLHPQALPWWSRADVDAAAARGLRLIWPLRHGALQPEASPCGFDVHAERARDGIDAARELFAGERAVLVCLMSACWYGIDYARRHPERVERLILVGACYRPPRGARAPGRLRDGLLRLSSRHRAGAALLLRFIGQRMRDPERMRAFLTTLYADSAADSAVLAAELDDPRTREALMLRFVLSAQSIAQDFLHLGFPNFDALGALDCPVSFVHGEQDPVHAVADVAALATRLDAPLDVLEGAGQLLYGAHWETVLDAVERASAGSG